MTSTQKQHAHLARTALGSYALNLGLPGVMTDAAADITCRHFLNSLIDLFDEFNLDFEQIVDDTMVARSDADAVMLRPDDPEKTYAS